MWISVAKKWHCEWNIFFTNRERCEVLTGYLSLGRRSGGGWANTWHWTEVLQSSSPTEVVAASLNSTFSSLSCSSRGIRSGAVGWGSVLQAGRSRVGFPMVRLEFFIEKNPSGRTMVLGLMQRLTEMSKGKGKVIPLQSWTGPQGSRRSRLPDFKTIGT
jgi:hypothetical protein